MKHAVGALIMSILIWLFVTVISCLFGLLAWNYVISPTFSCPALNFGQMFILVLAIRSLFGTRISTSSDD